MKKINLLLFSFVMLAITSFSQGNSTTLYPEIQKYLNAVKTDFNKIPEERKEQLKIASNYISTKLNSEKKASLVFICTHNSRRSHMSQLWALAAAAYYGIKGIASYSGGTEVSAFNERAIKALKNVGFVIKKNSEGANPEYEVSYSDMSTPVISFSKKYMDSPNPTSNFAAIMTCSHADKNCPVVHGASIKIPIPYEDPKISDGKPDEASVYNERCKQIATEMMYIFSLVNSSEN